MRRQAGFTLIELLLAMTLFSTVMIVVTVGFIGMNRSFTRTLARKELSETVQFLTEDITRAVRAQSANAVIENCRPDVSSSACYPGIAALCVGQVRYLWQPADQRTKLEQDAGPCSAPPQAGRTTVLRDLYKIRELKAEAITGKTGLFLVSGVLTTSDEAALRIPSGGYPFDITCKGSAEYEGVGTCAVEKFDFMISARGGV